MQKTFEAGELLKVRGIWPKPVFCGHCRKWFRWAPVEETVNCPACGILNMEAAELLRAWDDARRDGRSKKTYRAWLGKELKGLPKIKLPKKLGKAGVRLIYGHGAEGSRIPKEGPRPAGPSAKVPPLQSGQASTSPMRRAR